MSKKSMSSLKKAMAYLLTAAIVLSTLVFGGVAATAQIEPVKAEPESVEIFMPSEEHFDAFVGTNADSDGLSPIAFDEQFETVEGYFVKNIFDRSIITDWWAQQNDYISTAIYSDRTFRNFEMSMTLRGYDGANAYYWPMLIFGVEDPTQWSNQANGGFSVGTYNEGNTFLRGYVDGAYLGQADPTARNVGDNAATNGYFVSNSYGSWTMKIRVVDSAATVTISPDYYWGSGESWAYTYSYDIGDKYTGGYVGFASTGQWCRFSNFKITDLGGEVKMDNSFYFGSLDKLDYLFDAFYSDDADGKGLEPYKFSDRFNYKTSGFLTHDFDNSINTDYWSAQNDYISTALYNLKPYRNFELNVKMSVGQNGGAGYSWPFLIFGVEDPTDWVSSEDGGYQVFAYNEGYTTMKYYDAESATFTSKSDPHGSYHNVDVDGDGTADWTGAGTNYWYFIKLRVEGNSITITVDGNNPNQNPYSWTTTLEDYNGGYIGFGSTGKTTQFHQFEITDLGGDVAMDASPVFGSDAKNEYNFDAYYSEDADGSGLAASTMAERFPVQADGNGVKHNFDLSLISDYWAQQDDYISTAIYTLDTFKNFEIKMYVDAPETAGAQTNIYWPMIMFGVEDPTKWATEQGGGFAAYCLNDPRVALKGFVNGEYKNQMDPEQDSWYGHWWGHYLTVRVVGTIATVSVTQDGKTFGYSFDLGDDYKGGYVGFASTGRDINFNSFSVKNLDTSIEQITVNDVVLDEEINAELLTPMSELGLPETVWAATDDMDIYEVGVEWDAASYSMYKDGTQTVTGRPVSTETEDGKLIVAGDTVISAIVNLSTEKTKVACVGDSITYGDTVDAAYSYPTQLQSILGDGYMVENFGHCGIRAANYASESRFYGYSTDFAPDIVVIMLGTNDAWDSYWQSEESFTASLTALVESYKALSSNPKIYLATSAKCYLDGTGADRITEVVVPLQKQIAEATGATLVDINELTTDHSDWFNDGVHPNADGYKRLAYKFAAAINGKGVLGDADFNGTIDSEDIGHVRKALIGAVEIAADTDFDYHADGDLDIRDLVGMKKAIAGIK